MSRQLRILWVEDEQHWFKLIAEKLDLILGKGKYELLELEDQTSALDILNDYKSKNNLFDVIFADAELPEGITAGHFVLKSAKDICPRTRLFLVSQNFGRQELLDLEVDRTRLQVIAIAKASLTSPKDKRFEEALRDELAQWTREMMGYIDASEKAEIRQKLISGQTISGREVVTVLFEDWVLEDIFLLYWKKDSIDKQKIISCLTPNLTYSFSEAFGVLGIKQITHKDGKYYSDDPATLHKKIKEQLNDLDTMIAEISSETPEIAEKLEATVAKYEQFKQLYGQIESNVFDETLQLARGQGFQFKGSKASRLQHLVDDSKSPLARTLLEGLENILADLKTNLQTRGYVVNGSLVEVYLGECRGGEEFETNIPIHEILYDEFKGMFKSIFTTKGANIDRCEVFTCSFPVRSTTVDGYETLRLCGNALVFRHVGATLRPDTWLEVTQEPQWVRSMQKSLMFFGRMYLMFKSSSTGEFMVFDCTSFPVYPIGKFQELITRTKAKSLECMVSKDKKNTAYYIFTFPAWRQ